MTEDVSVIHSLFSFSRDSQAVPVHLLVLQCLNSRVLGTILFLDTEVDLGGHQCQICGTRFCDKPGPGNGRANTRPRSGNRAFQKLSKCPEWAESQRHTLRLGTSSTCSSQVGPLSATWWSCFVLFGAFKSERFSPRIVMTQKVSSVALHHSAFRSKT